MDPPGLGQIAGEGKASGLLLLLDPIQQGIVGTGGDLEQLRVWLYSRTMDLAMALSYGASNRSCVVNSHWRSSRCASSSVS